jgi:hypothetical protein
MPIIPKSGAWVMIKDPPTVEYPIDPLSIFYALPTDKIYWHGEEQVGWMNFDKDDSSPYWMMQDIGLKGSAGFQTFKSVVLNHFKGKTTDLGADAKKSLKKWEKMGWIDENSVQQQVKIKTVFGDVCIQPWEYTVVKDIAQYIEPVGHGEAVMRFLTQEKQLSGKIADQVFYLRSRGISFSDAVQLCISNVKTQNLFYLEMHPQLQNTFYRHFWTQWKRKVDYCIKNKRTDLLNYGPSWDYSNVFKSRGKNSH